MAQSRRSKQKHSQARRKIAGRAFATGAECRQCGKVGFTSEAQAIDALIGGRSGIRVYKCGSGLWHTTSRGTLRRR